MSQRELPKYEGFKFEVGQLLMSAFQAGEERLFAVSDYQVIERIYRECPGGIQLFYVCRPREAAMCNVRLVELNEIELATMPVEESQSQ